MDILTIIFLIPVFILILVSLFNVISGPFLKKIDNSLEKQPKISVMIPARNEENSIGKCLNSLKKQTYKNIEILVLNDRSTDGTLNEIKKFKEILPLKILNGKELPDGWLGKNYACNQLSKEATGDIYLFTDADNFYSKTAVEKTVKYFEKFKLDVLSTFPEQKTESVWEKLIIPNIDTILYSLLPLKFVYLFKSPSLTAANGQWIAFRKNAYQKTGGHEKVKDKIVEDMALFRNAKIMGLKTMTLAGTGEVYGKMYSNFKEIWHGLSKNTFGLTEFKLIPFMFLMFLLLYPAVMPFILIFAGMASTGLILLLSGMLWKLLLSLKFKHSLFFNTLLYPLNLGFLFIIGLNSVVKYYKGGIQWKGRKVKIN